MRHEIKGNRLLIYFDVEERSALWDRANWDEDFHSDQVMHEFLEPLICNSELDWIDPSETGDLTSAPMLGIRDENGDVTQRWAFMDYQVRSVLDDLADRGVAVFVS